MFHVALRRFSQREQVLFALFALLTLAAAGLVARGGPASISIGGEKAGTSAAAQAAASKLPLTFVPNKGQTDKSVRYYAEGAGHSFYFTPDKAVLSFTKRDKGVALDLLRLARARHEARGRRESGRQGQLPVGSEHRRNLPTYREVAYRNAWPDSTSSSGARGNLKYELRAQAGADLSKIALAYGGSRQSLRRQGRRPADRDPARHASRLASAQLSAHRRQALPVDSRYARSPAETATASRSAVPTTPAGRS